MSQILKSQFRQISRNMTTQRPSPPRLPPADQKIFDDLVRAAAAPAAPSANSENSQSSSALKIEEGQELHPDARKPLPNDFEGDVNPVTGEQGGPKREPLRHGDWSFGGRATDF